MRTWFARLLPRRDLSVAAPNLELTELRSRAEYERHLQDHEQHTHVNALLERSLAPKTHKPGTLEGYCFVCKSQVPFLVDMLYGSEDNGVLVPNWRERLVCPNCQLNNRMRAVMQILAQLCKPSQQARIHITEQTTALYARLKQDFPALTGSEFLGAPIPRGSEDVRGIRNEDLTQLSFADAELDFILSFDVFEHVPDYRAAFAECLRSLKPGGRLVFSVPFIRDAERNVVRATLGADGAVTHLLPPEYHGDPLSDAGCLCFYHFGWEMLDELRTIGFADACALMYWSRELGYMGGDQVLFIATKAAS